METMKLLKYFLITGFLIILLLNVSCGNKAKGWYDKGWDLARQGNLEDAVQCYDKALEINPDYVEAWYNKGLAYIKLSNWGGAVECFDKVIKLQPENEEAWFNKGQALFKKGHYSESIKCYDKALELKPDYALAQTYKEEAIKVKDTEKNTSSGGGGGGVNPFDTTSILNKAQNSADMYEESQKQ